MTRGGAPYRDFIGVPACRMLAGMDRHYEASMQDTMRDEDLDAYADAGTRLLGIPVAPEWRAAIRANLQVSLALGALVAAAHLPDEAEPAPVFAV